MRSAFLTITLSLVVSLIGIRPESSAIELTIELSGPRTDQVGQIVLVQRWDADGNATRKPDTKQKIGAPVHDAVAERVSTDRWTFRDLKPGRYDVIILGVDHLRIDGYDYPPVLEFDPFLSGMSATTPALRHWVARDIVRSRHYENIVEPLTIGDDTETPEDEIPRVLTTMRVTESELDPQKDVSLEEGEEGSFDDGTDDGLDDRPGVIRVLVALIRDEVTSHTADAATIRHEVWQYTYRYGGYQKEKRTRVFDRVILPRDELRKWTWLWDPRLGGLSLHSEGDSRTLRYRMPDLEKRELPGLYSRSPR
ncbi:MAG: hypothetical protein Q4C47_05245 [Planctomycetia bacterium]|nr:hypothetical protein [Planctomycetia bacterium]